jgi:signal peptidase I
VIAAAGDRMEFTSAGLVLNGQPAEEPYLASPRVLPRRRFDLLELQLSRSGGKVPNGQVVVVGDSAASSEDSAAFGYVSVTQLVGRVVAVKDRSGRLVQRPGLPAPPQAGR